MHTILRIDTSARGTGSVTRDLGNHLEQALLKTTPDARVMRRDLAATPLPHIVDTTIAGYYTPADQMTETLRNATALSDTLIAELRAADTLLLTVPMYNFSVPSALKAWIDQIVRIGHTFAYDGTNFTGLVTGKKAYVVCAYGAGGYGPDRPFGAANFVEPYLRFLLNFLGIADVTFFSIEATTAGAEVVAANAEAARRAIESALLAA